MIFSTLIIISAILIPSMIKEINNTNPLTAADPTTPDSVEGNFGGPTRIEGDFEELKLKGVRYIVEILIHSFHHKRHPCRKILVLSKLR